MADTRAKGVDMTERTREALAWAAGLFEGEGAISYTHRVPILALGTTDLDVLDRFVQIVGVGTVYPFTRTNPTPGGVPWKNGASWQTTNWADTQAVIGFLWCWLGDRRRARAHEVLSEYQARRAAQLRGHGTLAGELFGKRTVDLTPAEYTEYRRVQVARNRAARGVTSGHPPATGRSQPRE